MILVKDFDFTLLFTATVFSTYILCIECCVKKVRYGVHTDCLGKKGTNFTLSTLEDVSHVDCAMRCEEMYQCMLLFHNSRTRSCSFHNRTLTDLVMLPDVDSRCFLSDDIVDSWITGVIEASTSANGWSPERTIGQPDGQYWAPDGSGDEYLVVEFSGEISMEQVHTYEMKNGGSVRRISLLSPDGTWYPVWNATANETEKVYVYTTRWIWSHELAMTDFKASTIRIEIDQYTEIDAVKASGRRRGIR